MISAIIVNYHSSGVIAKSISSVLQDHGDSRVEVIVVDNTATADERERLKDLSRRLPFRLICSETNEGFARACNKAYGQAQGTFLLLLNPDAYVEPGSIGRLETFLRETPGAGAVSPQVYWDDLRSFRFPRYPFPSPLQDLLTLISLAVKAVGTSYSLFRRWQNVGLWRSERPVPVRNLSGGTVMLKREAVEQSGGLFDERFFLFYEDADLFLRMRKRGFRIFILPSAGAVHRYAHTVTKLEFMERTKALYYSKHFRTSRALLRRAAPLLLKKAAGPPGRDGGSWSRPPRFDVHGPAREGFLFEWSPSPLFVPAIGCFDSGASFQLPHDIWECLGAGTYYSRISRPDRRLETGTLFEWRKDG